MSRLSSSCNCVDGIVIASGKRSGREVAVNAETEDVMP